MIRGDFPKMFVPCPGARRVRQVRATPGRSRADAAACAGSVSPATLNHPALRRRVSPARLARVPAFRTATLRVEPDGFVRAALGTHNHGQGHATSFAQIISSRLGVPVEQIDVIEGDTDQVPYGTGTFGSRTIAVGGSALASRSGKNHRQGQADRGANAGDRRRATSSFWMGGSA